MSISRKLIAFCVGGLAMMSLVSHPGLANAAIVHVSALGGVSGNTVNNDTDSTIDWFTAVNDTSDNLYRERGGFGENGDQIYESWDNEENSPLLRSTVSGLASGQQYRVWVNYIRFGADGNDPDGNRGAVFAGLTSTSLSFFDAASGDGTNVGDAVLSGYANSDRRGLRGYLGIATADGTGEILVYVDDTNTSERSWYDGFSYEVVPEPSAFALSILGLLGLIGFGRRRKR
jgi:hypothetical protein